MIEVIARELAAAIDTFKFKNACIQLPEQVMPGDFLGSKADNKLIQLKVLISDVFGLQTTSRVSKHYPLVALLPLPLLLCK